jgi:hypothetical protein
MRRAPAILTVIALLATPLAVLARSATDGMPGCKRICCLQHGARSAHLHHPMNRAASVGDFCRHAAGQKKCTCAMRAGDQHMDYGFLAPVVPSAPSAIASVVIPDATRRFASLFAELPATGFHSAPFEPPRD